MPGPGGGREGRTGLLVTPRNVGGGRPRTCCREEEEEEGAELLGDTGRSPLCLSGLWEL